MAVAVNGVIPLGEVRARAAIVLAPATDQDPDVLIGYPDQVGPPALVVVWGDPWLEQPRTMGPSQTLANLVILCVGSRVDAEAGIDTIEQLAVHAINRLRNDTYHWPLRETQAPREWVISGVHYLGARLTYQLPVALTEGG